MQTPGSTPTDPARWRRIEPILDQALDLPPEERQAFLDEACGGDSRLRADVEALLEADEQAGGFLGAPAGEYAADLLAADAAETEAGDDLAGRQVGPYRLLREIGRGGMGTVYEAEDARLGRRVAVKLLPPEVGRDRRAKERFLREARAASALDHPNLCTVHDVGESDGRLFIVLAFYEGETLRERLERGPLPPAEAREVATQVARGLARAHEAGITHRDIKPANVMLTRRGEAKILDFGIAKLAGELTLTGAAWGTPAYMSPEQASGRPVDGRTDVWAVGVLLYEMLAGRRPFAGEDARGVLSSILTQEPEPLAHLRPDVPPELARVAARALAKDPAGRYASAAELLADLESGTAAPPPFWRRLTRRPRALRVALLAGAAAAAVALLLLVAWQLGRPLSRGDPRSAAAHAPAPAVAAGFPSIAVLPFADLSREQDQEYFSDGLTDELITTLASLGRLRVAGRTSSFYFKSKDAGFREIGERLNVSTLLEGSVRKDGNRLRITTQLTSVADGYQLWSQTYDRELDDIFAVQEEIARSVAEALKVALLAGVEVAPRPIDVGAYNLLLEARFFLRRGTAEDTQKAIASLHRAAELAPDHAPIWAELGGAYSGLGTRVETRAARGEAQRRARGALTRALELDPNLAQAHARMAHFYRREWELAAAAASMKRALELASNDLIVLGGAANQAVFEGRLEEAIAYQLRILESDPLAAGTHFNLAWNYFVAGRLDEAEDRWHKVLALSPNYVSVHWGLGVLNLERGRWDDAKTHFEREAGFPWQRLHGLALHAYAKGDRAAAAAALRRFVAAYGAERPTLHALLRAYRGELDEAFRLLEGAVAARDNDLLWLYPQIPTHPLFSRLRRDRRWRAITARLEGM